MKGVFELTYPVAFRNKCSILMYQNKTGELRLVRATNSQLAIRSRKPSLPNHRGFLFSVPAPPNLTFGCLPIRLGRQPSTK